MARAAAARERGRPGSGSARESSGLTLKRSRPAARRVPPPLEHRMLMTATLCLLAFGAVMVYSASSPLGALSTGGTGTGEFIRYLLFGGIGLVGMHVLSRRGLEIISPRLVTALLLGSFTLLLLVLVPGVGVEVNGARRWFAAGPIQFQPSEVMKIALVLYAARYLADHPKRMRSFRAGGGTDRRGHRTGVPTDRRRARPGYDDRRGADDRGAPDRCRHADALRRGAGRDRRPVRDSSRHRAAVRAGAADFVPAPVGAATSPAPATSPSRDRLRSDPEACSGWAWAAQCKRSSTSLRRRPTSFSP